MQHNHLSITEQMHRIQAEDLSLKLCKKLSALYEVRSTLSISIVNNRNHLDPTLIECINPALRQADEIQASLTALTPVDPLLQIFSSPDTAAAQKMRFDVKIALNKARILIHELLVLDTSVIHHDFVFVEGETAQEAQKKLDAEIDAGWETDDECAAARKTPPATYRPSAGAAADGRATTNRTTATASASPSEKAKTEKGLSATAPPPVTPRG